MIARLLLIALFLPAAALAQDPTEPHTLTVSGTGTVERTPDRAVLRFAVENLAPTADAAARSNAAAMDAVITALRRIGLSDDQIRTVGYRLDPEYDYSRDPGPRRPGEDHLIGFRARNTVLAMVDDVSRVGAAIDAAIGAGANRVDGLSFQLRDAESARLEALERAVAAARTEAETIARALGRTLGPAISVSSAGMPAAPARFAMDRAIAAEAAIAPPTPIEPGSLTVHATVTIIYRLEAPR